MALHSILLKTGVSLFVSLGLIAFSPLGPGISGRNQGGKPDDPEGLAAAPAALFGSVLENSASSTSPEPSATPTVPADPPVPETPGSLTHFLPSLRLSPPAAAAPVLPTPAAPQAASLPVEHDVPAFSVRHQLLSLDCEAASAVQWAGYFGVKINELDFQYALPRSDNPDYGFVGDVNDAWGEVPPHGYGVYAGPVADLLNSFGVPAQAVKGYTLDQLEAKIAADQPVIVWVVGHVEPGTAYSYIDAQGRTAVVAAYEHVILVTGYTASAIHYVSEGVYYSIPIQGFLRSWSVLGSMAVIRPEFQVNYLPAWVPHPK